MKTAFSTLHCLKLLAVGTSIALAGLYTSLGQDPRHDDGGAADAVPLQSPSSIRSRRTSENTRVEHRPSDNAITPRWLQQGTATTNTTNNSSSSNSSSNSTTLSCTETCCAPFLTAATAACPTVEPAESSSSSPFAFLPDTVQFILMIVLLLLSALFSGLTLGLMGLDKTGLEIVMDSDDPVHAEYAKKIYPMRKNGNLLLCTLLLGNVAVNALLSIILADWAGGIVGLVVSTFSIVIFGEIIPQALCSRYALYIGSRSIPLVRVIMFVLLPICKPLAWALDKALGAELATTYSGNEMLKLLQIHVDENVIDPDTAKQMTGALKYKDVPVRDVMTPLKNTFMLKTDEKLNFETIAKIFKTGYSRIPVYEVSKNNVSGLLFVKDLIFIDPEDETRVSDFVEIFGRGVHVVWQDEPLGDVLRELKQGRSHMALVRDVNNQDETQDPFYEVVGIITLEDIIEEILGDEIVDETDAFLDGTHSVRLDRVDAFKFARLRLLDSKIVDESLSQDETKAVTAHLWKNFPKHVSLLTENQLHRLIAETRVSLLPTAEQEIGESLPRDLMYEKGVPSDTCTLILNGKVSILVGADQFRSDVSAWGLLGGGALEDSNYTPDFSAFVSAGPCRCIQLTRSRFASAVDASTFERAEQNKSSRSLGDENPTKGGQSDGPSMEFDVSEASRKSKLMTALRTMDQSSKRQNLQAGNESLSSAVAFAEPGALKENSTAPRIRDQSSSTLPATPSNNAYEMSSSRFDYIASPAGDRDVTDGDPK